MKMVTPDPEQGMFHQPVMADEVALFLHPQSGTIVDGTVGGGGHARVILERATGPIRLLGIDADGEAIAAARRQLESFDNVELVHSDYCRMGLLARQLGLLPVSGVLLDLGVSLYQLKSPARGFGFDVAGPLDMRFDQSQGQTAADLLRRMSEKQLCELLRRWGEEPMSGRIARSVTALRQGLRTTADLAAAVRRAVPRRRERATLARVFQAVRIAVNRELERVAEGLRVGLELVAPGGRMVVIAYHSLEDRLVKRSFRAAAQAGQAVVLTPKPLRPSESELARNPRARSARLRAVEIIRSGQ